jgi:glycosyltransferase involved in cell wall biosynthesis
MKILLRRNPSNSYGQDFRSAAAIAKLKPLVADRQGDDYALPVDISQVSLVISFNCDCLADANFVANLPPQIPVIVHFQLQPSFLDDEAARLRAANVLRRANRIVVPAAFMADLIRKDFGITHAQVIRNGCDPDVFHPQSSAARDQYCESYGIPRGVTLVTWVSQATAAKGTRTLTRLAEVLPENVVLLLRSFSRKASRVPELDTVVAAGSGRVFLQAEDGKRKNLPTPYADALLVTSLSEVAPLVVTEALMAGIPVISTDCTPFYDELALEGFGQGDIRRVPLTARSLGQSRPNLDYSEDEAESVAASIAAELADLSSPEDSERIARSGRAVAAGMSLDRMLKAFQELWDEVARAHAG